MSRQDTDFEALRTAYRPAFVTTLFVGESRPKNGTFFYCGDSNLGRYTSDAFSGVSDSRATGAVFLNDFQSRGFYLVDLCTEPVNGHDGAERSAARSRGVEQLAAVIAELHPEAIVVVMKDIKSYVRQAVGRSGLVGVPLYFLPFPAMGNQTAYVQQLRQLLPSLPSVAGSEATG